MNKLLIKQIADEIIEDEKICGCESHKKARATPEYIDLFRKLTSNDASIFMILGLIGKLCARDSRILNGLLAHIKDELDKR